ncbi:MAG: hypothetical protein GYB31_03830 [Bacteroidetes bacterium]|nr:hypothetical protein [Bacteroidota bacterium]
MHLPFRSLLIFLLFSQVLMAQDSKSLVFNFSPADEGPILEANLLEPSGPYQKIVIIIPDEGPDKRDTHPILTSHLLKQGIAVCRYDDRGTGKSKGDFEEATTYDHAEDLIGLSDFFRTSESYAEMQLGFLGFGEGGLTALIAVENEASPDFMVLIGTPAMSSERIIFAQTENMPQKWQFGNEAPRETRSMLIDIHRILREDLPEKETKKAVKNYLKEKGIKKYDYDKFLSPQYRFHIDYDPTETLRFMKVNTLYLVGEKDAVIQAKQNDKRIWGTGNQSIEYEIVENVAHNLQFEGHDKYDMAEKAMERISTWILNN